MGTAIRARAIGERRNAQMLHPLVNLTLEALKKLLRAFGALEEIPEATGTGGAVG